MKNKNGHSWDFYYLIGPLCAIIFLWYHTIMCLIAELRFDTYKDRKAFYEYWSPRNPEQYEETKGSKGPTDVWK